MTGTDPVPVPTVYIGIDPGLHGAIAVQYPEEAIMRFWDMPLTPHGNLDAKSVSILMYGFRGMGKGGLNVDCRAVIEHPDPVPHQRASGIATFWEQVGILEGIMVTLRIPFRPVKPRVWRAAMNCGAKSTKEAKSLSIKRAQELYPDADLGGRADAGRADAILISLYAYQGRLGKVAL